MSVNMKGPELLKIRISLAVKNTALFEKILLHGQPPKSQRFAGHCRPRPISRYFLPSVQIRLNERPYALEKYKVFVYIELWADSLKYPQCRLVSFVDLHVDNIVRSPSTF